MGGRVSRREELSGAESTSLDVRKCLLGAVRVLKTSGLLERDHNLSFRSNGFKHGTRDVYNGAAIQKLTYILLFLSL